MSYNATLDRLKLLRRVQREAVKERIRDFGCDRTTITHADYQEREPEENKDFPRYSLHDFYNRKWNMPRTERMFAGRVARTVICKICRQDYRKCEHDTGQ